MDAGLDLAEYLAETYFPNDRIDPLDLAARSNITSSFGSYEEEFDGLLELKEERFHIYLNEDRLLDIHKPRARFTAAHELGHYFIDDHRNALVAGIQPHPSFTEFVMMDSVAELQADQFAATLLMPPKRFNSSARNKDASLETIVGLSDLFGTSVMSTAIRYARSDVASVSVMLWKEPERKWCWSSKDVWNITHNKAFKNASRVPAGSATSELMESPVRKKADERATVLSQWFPYVHAGTANDRICREEAMRLGDYGVLTLLEIQPI